MFQAQSTPALGLIALLSVSACSAAPAELAADSKVDAEQNRWLFELMFQLQKEKQRQLQHLSLNISAGGANANSDLGFFDSILKHKPESIHDAWDQGHANTDVDRWKRIIFSTLSMYHDGLDSLDPTTRLKFFSFLAEKWQQDRSTEKVPGARLMLHLALRLALLSLQDQPTDEEVIGAKSSTSFGIPEGYRLLFDKQDSCADRRKAHLLLRKTLLTSIRGSDYIQYVGPFLAIEQTNHQQLSEAAKRLDQCLQEQHPVTQSPVRDLSGTIIGYQESGKITCFSSQDWQLINSLSDQEDDLKPNIEWAKLLQYHFSFFMRAIAMAAKAMKARAQSFEPLRSRLPEELWQGIDLFPRFEAMMEGIADDLIDHVILPGLPNDA